MLDATDTEARAVVHPALRRQEAGSAELHRSSAEPDSLRRSAREKIKLPKRSNKGEYDDQATLEGRTFVPEKY